MAKKNGKSGTGFIPSTIFSNGPKVNGLQDSSYPDYFITEEEKVEDDKERLKKIFNYHEDIARTQILSKQAKYIRNYKLAYGFINPVDYGLEEVAEYKKEIDILAMSEQTSNFSDTIQLEFFPIIPNIVNMLKQELVRKYHNVYPRMVDSESINEILDEKQSEIINFLVESKRAKYDATLPEEVKNNEEEYNKAMDAFNKLPEIENYYKTRYKPEIVLWAEHLLERDNIKFSLDNEFSKDVFEDHIIQADRYIHVQDLGDDYAPEYLYPANCASSKSPLQKCVSQSVWFYWYENLSVQAAITKYGNLMNDEQVESMRKNAMVTHGLTIDDSNWDNKKWNNEVNTKNWFALKNIMQGMDSLQPNEIQLAHQYFLMPRKLATLTIRIKTEDGLGFEDVFSDIIDPEIYEIVNKPIYKKNSEHTLENLIEGEHLDKFYINEVYYGLKITNGTSYQYTKDTDADDQVVWIKMDKLDYQGKPENQLFGTVIPVFGGKTNFKMEEYNKSIVDLTSPHQIYYNYLMNKIKELVITELMPFYIINQGVLGANSQDESWKSKELFKFIHAGQEFGITVGDNDGFNLNGQPTSQLVNPDRSVAIKTRWELAQLFKNECYAQLGLTPQFMGDIKADETATGVTQGVNRSATQIQNLFDEHHQLMKRVKQYMLELAQIKTFKKGGMAELSYINSDAQNIIFQMDADKLPLTRQVGLFLVDDNKSNEVLERMKQLVIMDNTMGADTYEKLLVLRANSETKLLDTLYKERLRREEIEGKQMESQQRLQEQTLNSQMEAQIAKQEFEAEQNRLDRETDILIAQINTLRGAKDQDSNSNAQFDSTEIMRANLDNAKLSADVTLKTRQIEEDRQNKMREVTMKQQELQQKRQENYNNYQAKLKEINSRLQISNNQLAIAKENKSAAELKAARNKNKKK